MSRTPREEEYRIGIICALPRERRAVEAVFDIRHAPLPQKTGDRNAYSYGRIGLHNVVVTSLPVGKYGTAAASTVVFDIRHSFPDMRVGFMVGVAGAIPREGSPNGDIRLGDIVVAAPGNGTPAVVRYSQGSMTTNGFQIKSGHAESPQLLLRAVTTLRLSHERNGPTYLKHLEAMLRQNPELNNPKLPSSFFNRPDQTDRLFKAHASHPAAAEDCTRCGVNRENLVIRGTRRLPPPPAGLPARLAFVTRQRDGQFEYPVVHYGSMVSTDILVKNAIGRDNIFKRIKSQMGIDTLCFEMEASGFAKNWPHLVIRGICDYADTHKNKDWQNFASATAAAYLKDLLMTIDPQAL